MDEQIAPVEVAGGSTFEQSVLLRLDELGRQLERVLTLACPVCGPALVAQIHPESDWHGTATWAVVEPSVVEGNGR
jgi:hypothetical protein